MSLKISRLTSTAMRKSIISILFLSFCFIASTIGQDHLSYPEITYSGSRIFLENLEITPGKKGKSKINTKIINTGKDLVTNQGFGEDKVLLKTHSGVIGTIGDQGLASVYYSLSAIKWTLAPGATLELTSNLLKKPSGSNKTGNVPFKTPVLEKPSKNTKRVHEKVAVEEVLEKTSKKKSSKIDQSKKTKKKPVKSTAQRKLIKEKVKKEEPQIEEESTQCSDLQIVNLEIEKQTKKFASIKYTLVNNGMGDADLGKNGKATQNLAVRAFLSSSAKLSRGAITLGGSMLKVSEEQSKLKSGEMYVGTIRLPLYKLTKFTPFIVLQVDPYQQLIECDETNNVNAINVVDTDSNK